MKNFNRAKSGVVAGVNDLATTHPDIVQEWDYENNTEIEPYEISYGSNYIAHWKCNKGHPYVMSVKARVGLKNGCPVCSGEMIVPGINDLATLFPEIGARWHPSANGDTNPSEIAPHSNKTFYWLCDKGHTYDAVVHDQVSGQGCPYCSNRRLLVGFNDLKARCPEAAEDWDYELNEDGPDGHKYCSTETVHWKCRTCGTQWTARIRDRVRAKHGCPLCAQMLGGRAKHQTELSRSGGITDPLLLKEWDYEKNKRDPSEYTPNCQEYTFWICSKCGYHYPAKISNRANGRGCPCCANKVVVPGINDLATTHPELAREWHPTKNLPLTPELVTYGKGKKVWWICPEGHEYPATILHRASGGTNCPICNYGRQTSFAEQAVFYYVKKVFPDAINRYTEIFGKGMELDIYIPSIKVGIEYDGVAWHKKDKLERENKKCEICHQHGIKLIRLKENLAKIPNSEQYRNAADMMISLEGNMYEQKNLALVIQVLLDKIDPRSSPWTRTDPSMIYSPVDINIKRDENEIRGYMTKIRTGSFAELYPQLAGEWHPTKNGNVTPDKVKPHSGFEAWWVCPNCENEYKSPVGRRVSGCGCPKCGQIKSIRSRSKRVQMIDPEKKIVLRTFDSIAEASRQMKISDGNIGSVLHGKRAHAGGFIWQYEKRE